MVIGEVGLGGEIRPAHGTNQQAPHRSREARFQTSGDSETRREGIVADCGDGSGGEDG